MILWIESDQIIVSSAFLALYTRSLPPLRITLFSFPKIHANLGTPLPRCGLAFFISRSSSCVHDARRLSKEKKLYARENQDQKLKVDNFVANNADEWDIKNGVRSFYPRIFTLDPRAHVRNAGRVRTDVEY